MPRSRKAKASGPSAAQSTLSFNNKSARVTKPNTRQDDTAAKKLSEPAIAQLDDELEAQIPGVDDVKISEPELGEPEEAEAKPEPEDGVDIAIREPPSKLKSKSTKKSKAVPGKDGRELEAEKVTDAQLRKYWQAEEDSRLAPRIHQNTLSLHEKILRHFDLSSQYGPCIGIQRLQRWKRANMLGLHPPVEVLAVLLREEDTKTSQGCGKLAYIDELGGGRVVLVE